jgi:hypothetical protein
MTADDDEANIQTTAGDSSIESRWRVSNRKQSASTKFTHPNGTQAKAAQTIAHQGLDKRGGRFVSLSVPRVSITSEAIEKTNEIGTENPAAKMPTPRSRSSPELACRFGLYCFTCVVTARTRTEYDEKD